jgi:hypothetical protein
MMKKIFSLIAMIFCMAFSSMAFTYEDAFNRPPLSMFIQNPNATPIWLLMAFSAISCFGFPRIKKFVSKYTSDGEKQKFYTFILWLVLGAIVVTLSMVFFP